jgi:putative DNA-invertase from lambdoid prophage Rac
MQTNHRGVFGQGQTVRVALYARVSTHDQQTLPMQLSTMRNYVRRRDWIVALEIEDIASGAKQRSAREQILIAARRREIDAIIVWRLDRWSRSLTDVVLTLKELHDLNIGFVSLNEALDLTTPAGKATAGMLAVFAEFERDIIRERVKAGIDEARRKGIRLGRPPTALARSDEVQKLFTEGISKRQIASRLNIGRASVIRILQGISQIK